MSECLVVASKVKGYIKEQSGMRTSASFIEALTEVVKKVCEEAVTSAEANKRKTVLDKDVN